MSETLAEPTEHLVAVMHRDGYTYTGRITGKLISQGESPRGTLDIYLTDDARLLLHNEHGTVEEVTLEEVSEWAEPATYMVVALALGEKPIIDL